MSRQKPVRRQAHKLYEPQDQARTDVRYYWAADMLMHLGINYNTRLLSV